MFERGVEKITLKVPMICGSIKSKLRLQTLHWLAYREKLKVSESDRFMGQLYEILVKGKTNYKSLDAQW